MSHTTRRTFLVGAGAVTTAAAIADAPAAFAASATHGTSLREGVDLPLVAHVADPRSDTLVLYVGTEAAVVRDRDLVRRLTRAAGR
ncbi:hypothetical protein [Intrasporangium flavum]|uniref:hypothetical protein n=1 Tax=Intrasporangium flavum TaxID=1428657 RepID=UPI00096DC6BF|nr:hypothetical protein [Intrasporangium flavum]